MTPLEADPTRAAALQVEDLRVSYRVRGRDQAVVRDVSFEIGRHESFGLVGESGCGKSTTALAISRYLPRNGRITSGRVSVVGRDVMSLGREDLRLLRARSISTVYQEPGRSLNPSMTVGRQVAEVFEALGATRKRALERAEEALRTVQIADPGRVMGAYPHQLSGGMLQRVVIAMAIVVDPTLLILDEPTTALDATVEAEILDLISGLRDQFGTAVLVISHNLAVISRMCDRVGVMYAGEIVEQGPADTIFDNPSHPYTVGLLRCVPRDGQRRDEHRLDTIPGLLPRPDEVPSGCSFAPRCGLVKPECRVETPPAFPLDDGHTSRCFRHDVAGDLPWITTEQTALARRQPSSDQPLIRAENVAKTYAATRQDPVKALVGVDVEVRAGETLGIVGESGCGKSTLAKVLVGLTSADPHTRLEVAGRKIDTTSALQRTPEELRLVQMVFQNAGSALNRRHTVRHAITRALVKLSRTDKQSRAQRVADIISSVRMEPRHLPMRPAQLSGGLQQRVAISRAFAGEPSVLICDEPTSALDVSVQAAVLNLLVDLQHQQDVAYIFISHDLGVVRYLSDRIAVLYLGRIVEHGPAASVFAGPHHPYTEALLSAAPTLGGPARERIRLAGEIPSPSNPPSGCVFHTRCHRRLSDGTCETVEPEPREIEPGRFISCHLPTELLARTEPPPNR